MIIQELYVKNFGRFSGKTFKPGPGINLIVGRNESGKSTLAQFVKAMLFGMKKGRGRAAGKDTFRHYTPWGGAAPAGEMIFACQDRMFRLRRTFPEEGDIFCLDDGERLSIKDGDLKMLLGGLEEGFYEQAVSTGCGDTEPGAAFSETLEHYFLNLESTKEEQADVQRALKYLKERRKEAESEYQIRYRSRQDRMGQLENQIFGYEKESERLKTRLLEETRTAEETRAKVSDTGKRGNVREYRKGWSAEYLAAAMASVIVILFISMDHLFPAVIMAVLGIFFLFAGMIKDHREGYREEESEEERKRMEAKIRREHLEEECRELQRMAGNCKEEWKELWKATKEEDHLQMEMEACDEAARRIREAADSLAAGWGKRLEEDASSILNRVTAGKYYGLKIGGRMDITVTDGERVLRPDQLSFGTCRQIWMSVRLAAAMFLSEEPIPLVLDDAFLSWDEERLEGVLSWLALCGRQVLLFTGQEREERILARKSLPYSKIVLDE